MCKEREREWVRERESEKEWELAYCDVTVHHINHYATENSRERRKSGRKKQINNSLSIFNEDIFIHNYFICYNKNFWKVIMWACILRYFWHCVSAVSYYLHSKNGIFSKPRRKKRFLRPPKEKKKKLKFLSKVEIEFYFHI